MEIKPNGIYLGDCYELIKQIPDKSIDLIYTDIPYVMYWDQWKKTSKIAEKFNNALWNNKGLTEGINYEVFNEFVRVLKKTYLYIWVSKDQILDVMNWFCCKGCNCNILCWCKTNPIPFGGSTFLSDIEYCLCFYEGIKNFNNGADHKHKWFISGLNVEDKKNYEHPTIKPLQFVKKHIENLTKEGDVVLDPFCGSGTTLKACQELNRQYIGFEINEKYYNIAKDRLNNINAKGEVSLF